MSRIQVPIKCMLIAEMISLGILPYTSLFYNPKNILSGLDEKKANFHKRKFRKLVRRSLKESYYSPEVVVRSFTFNKNINFKHKNDRIHAARKQLVLRTVYNELVKKLNSV